MKSNWVIVQKYAASLLELVNAEKQIDQTVQELVKLLRWFEFRQSYERLLHIHW